jgi:hypothetical protein
MREINEALRTRLMSDVLVIREEYKTVFEALMSKAETSSVNGVAVTGQPGIGSYECRFSSQVVLIPIPYLGKTMFLFYVLLRRLESKLPTAVQLRNNVYFIFDEQGATVHSIDDEDLRLRKCWALADSNIHVKYPCLAFMMNAKFIIQTTPPEPERWKGWAKEYHGTWFVMDLPSVPEIAAILYVGLVLLCWIPLLMMRLCRKENCNKTSSFLPFVRKYGPSIRDAINFTLGNITIESMNDEVLSSMATICQAPLSIFRSALPRSEASNALFIRRPQGRIAFMEVESFFPTPYLIETFEKYRCQLANTDALNLFYMLRVHALTRTAAGWAHEHRMHKHLGTGRAALKIFRGNVESTMQSSTHMLPGILDGPKQIDVSDSFYWMPFVSNIQGVDSVLGTSDGAVYAIQAAIEGDHKEPMEGIRKVWTYFKPDVRAQRMWHYVVVANTELAATKYVNEFSKMMRGFILGEERVPVQVWGCVVKW